MKKVVIVPARYSSSRLPGKPLLDIAGKPMIVRVCQVVADQPFDLLAVATDDQRIADAVSAAGFTAVLTRSDHPSGTDRLQEAATLLGLAAEDLIINLQGDEPLMPAANVHQVAQLLMAHPEASVATLYVKQPSADLHNPNLVKLVQGVGQQVLYFSRAPIPHERDDCSSTDRSFRRHVGLYAYRKAALDQFVSYPPGALEQLEKLEQLRFLEQGHQVVASLSELPIPPGVDTVSDIDAVRAIFGGEGS